ncbi:hypothetical protein D9M70_537940 [compost metagenome]
MGLGDVVDEFHHVHGLAHAGAAEQAHLAALGERAHQVDHLDAGFQQVLRGRQFVVRGGLAVDGGGQRLVDRTTLVDGCAQHVHDATQRRLAHGHGDGGLRVGHDQAAAQAVGRTQRNRADHAVAELLLDFERQCAAFELEGVVDLGHLVAREFHVDHSANTLNDLALNCFCLSHVCSDKNLNLLRSEGLRHRRPPQRPKRFPRAPW